MYKQNIMCVFLRLLLGSFPFHISYVLIKTSIIAILMSQNKELLASRESNCTVELKKFSFQFGHALKGN